MNPFEEWLQKILAKPPKKEEEKNMWMDAISRALMTAVAASSRAPMEGANVLGQAYGDRNRQLMQAASQAMQPGANVPLSDYGVAPQNTAQRDLALDVMSAGAGSGMKVGAELLSSAPAVGKASLLSNLPKWLQPSIEYNTEKELLREKLVDEFRRLRHPMEGQAPARRIYHSSRGIFEAPTLDLARQGAGVGDFWQGTGAAYVAESPQVRDYYRNLLAKSQLDYQLPSGKIIADPSTSLDKIITKLENRLDAAKRRLYDNYSDENIKEVATLQQQYNGAINRRVEWAQSNAVDSWLPEIASRDLADSRKTIEELLQRIAQNPDDKFARTEFKSALKQFNFRQKELNSKLMARAVDPRVTSYSGFFYANPDELFNLNLPIAQQPAAERIIAGLNELPVGTSAEVGEFGVVLPGERVGDAMVRQQASHLAVPNLSSTAGNEMIISGQRGNSWSARRPEFTSATPWQTMEALKSKGIVGNQYLDRRSLEAAVSPEGIANPTSNYVVTDPSRLRFTDLFGAANPFSPLGTAMQALQNEQEKKNAATKPRKKP